MKWVSQGDSFSSVLELKKVQLFFKDMTAFFIFKTLITKNAKNFICLLLSTVIYVSTTEIISVNILELILSLSSKHTYTEHTLKTKIQFLLYCL